ncbi:adenylate/guanylate cyclase domain-containing protein [Treponema sp.]|uniref:adenylate/guanylate cyclase domain-containing protein n=1 Tax=Treponema sp. TaxID=166 RepID=UPI002580F433|nr:adenylate/guanylate cyclase domain-containing protein [Treponema sp.]MBE6354200.1 adenylate/guanylate cyclase domain-containing protein [Treponema sp.]
MRKLKSVFPKVGSTRIIPISFKLMIIFVSLLTLSNFATNFVNSYLARRQIINLNNSVMVSQLKDIFTAAGNQYQIYMFTGNRDDSISAVKSTAERGFELAHSAALAFDRDGKILFSVSAADDKSVTPEELEYFSDKEAVSRMNESLQKGISDGSIIFESDFGQYYGIYKYQEDWGCYFVRAELRSDTMKSNIALFGIISLVIIGIVTAFLFAGLYMYRHILRNVHKITGDLYSMQQKQHLSLIDLSDSPNDDVTYLAASFNSLSSTINNLLGIFQKFASKDVVAKAYKEHQIRLEGSGRDLVMLFSDIKSFTYRTETLGNEIIDLLNVHYDRVINRVHENSGVIGSIIGDAILAVYGTEFEKSKALCALESAWQITEVTAQLRTKMTERKENIEKNRPLTESEQKVFQAVLIDIGVGIDGGNVFYGNIGSDEHMTNTVIGDNVNSASRLEGLTRIYHLPVIVSEYIKDEIESEGNTKYCFYELDTVQVKGKTEGKKIYFPFNRESDEFTEEQFIQYEKALQLYYDGKWKESTAEFKKCTLEAAQVFLDRMRGTSLPEKWSGIWTMQTK